MGRCYEYLVCPSGARWNPQGFVLAVVLVLPAVGGTWANHIWPESFPVEAVLAARLVFLAFVVARLLVFILRAPKVNSEVLCAGGVGEQC